MQGFNTRLAGCHTSVGTFPGRCQLLLHSIRCGPCRVHFISMAFRPGRGTRVQRGAAPTLHILRKKGSFLRPPHVRDFVKRRVLICTQVLSVGVKVQLQSTKYMLLQRQVTPEVTGLPSLLLLLLPPNRQRIITSKVKMCVPFYPMLVF